MIAHQAGRSAGWGRTKVVTEDFLATPRLRLVEDAEADRFGAPRAVARRAKSQRQMAEILRAALGAHTLKQKGR